MIVGFIQKNLLTLLVTPLLILLVAGSFYRFIILRDYYVTYEIQCDPTSESCYLRCEDEACTNPYYYAYIEKYAATVYGQCGNDITDCAAAYSCLPEDKDNCTITYCNPMTEDCADFQSGDELELESKTAQEEVILEIENEDELIPVEP